MLNKNQNLSFAASIWQEPLYFPLYTLIHWWTSLLIKKDSHIIHGLWALISNLNAFIINAIYFFFHAMHSLYPLLPFSLEADSQLQLLCFLSQSWKLLNFLLKLFNWTDFNLILSFAALWSHHTILWLPQIVRAPTVIIWAQNCRMLWA